MKKIIISISLSIICLVVGIFSFLTNDLTAYHHWMSENGPRIMENFRRDRDRGNNRNDDRSGREDFRKDRRDDRDSRGSMRGPGDDHHQGPNDGHHQGPGMNRPAEEKSQEENK